MAGHSQFKNIMHRKNAQDRKRAKEFARAAREITVATRIGGGEAANNARLRAAIGNARAVNMPRDNIERAIQKGLGNAENSADIEEIRYEGYGPAGVAFIVETVTDNRNRSSSAVRTAFSKYDGNLGTKGSVIFQFARLGSVTVEMSVSEEELMNMAIELDAEEFEHSPQSIEFFVPVENLARFGEKVQTHTKTEIISALVWKPTTTVELKGNQAASALRLFNALDDLDDVQSVMANFVIAHSDEEIEQMLASR